MTEIPADILKAATTTVSKISSLMEDAPTLGAAATEVIAEALMAREAWRLIETYQTDAVKGPFAPYVFCGHAERKWIRIGRFDLGLKRWHYSGTNERSQYAQVEGDAPTHWMPLPSPPAIRSGEHP